MDATALLSLLRKKSFAKAYEAARANPALVNTFEKGDAPETPFHWACRFGDQATMRELMYGLHFYNTKGTYSMNRDWLDDTSLGILGPSLVGLQALVLAPAIQADEGNGFTPRAFEHLKPASATLRALTLDFTESDPHRSLLAALTPATFPKLETLTIAGLEATRRKGLKIAWAKGAAALVFA